MTSTKSRLDESATQIPGAISDLLRMQASEGLELTATPFTIEEHEGGWQVTLNACKPQERRCQTRPPLAESVRRICVQF